MQKTRTLWRWLAVVFFLSFAALGWIGWEIYLDKPPIPQQVDWFAVGVMFLVMFAFRLLGKDHAVGEGRLAGAKA